MQLYNVGYAIKNILEMIEETDDEDAKKALFKSLEQVEEGFEAKIDNIIGHVKNKKARIEVIDKQMELLEMEKKKLRSSKQALKNNIDFVLNNVWQEIVKSGRERFKSALHSVWSQRTRPKIEVIDVEAIPDDFVVLERKADKNAIFKHHSETGEVLPGTEVVQGEGVRVR